MDPLKYLSSLTVTIDTKAEFNTSTMNCKILQSKCGFVALHYFLWLHIPVKKCTVFHSFPFRVDMLKFVRGFWFSSPLVLYVP